MEIEVKKSPKSVDYITALKFLDERVKDVINGKKPELLWILEHKPVFTAGKSYKESEILNKKIKIIKKIRFLKEKYESKRELSNYFWKHKKRRHSLQY